jgi:uncharacterized protein YuzE
MMYAYDPEANALYIHFTDKPYAFGEDLDRERRIDYAVDYTPIGVELACVRSGVNLSDLPATAEIAAMLRRLDIPIYA